jgi:hypothetical protein
MTSAKGRCRLRTASALLGVALVAYIVVAPTTYAQSSPPIHRAIGAALVLEKEMSTAWNNLRQMMHGLPTIEQRAADAVVQATIDFQDRLSQVITVGQIIMDMKSAEDRSTVRLYFSESSHTFVSSADADVEYVNQKLIYFTTPAALAEATKLRDSMVEVRDLFTPFASKPGD